jgi:DNA-directed RNA polymerase specialized sigma24 family protein
MAPARPLPPDQFQALAELLRLRTGPAQEVARLVLVDGLAVPEAARTAGLEYTAASQAVRRARRGLELCRVAAGI